MIHSNFFISNLTGAKRNFENIKVIGDFLCEKISTYPMKTNRKMPAVIRAPRDAGDNIPNMAKTAKIDVHYEY